MGTIIAITLTRDVSDNFLKIDESLSGHFNLYDDCPSDELITRFQDSPLVKLCAVLVPQMVGCDEVKEVFAWARYINEVGISADLLENPLTKLGEKLFNEQRLLDYHRCVLDVKYRD